MDSVWKGTGSWPPEIVEERRATLDSREPTDFAPAAGGRYARALSILWHDVDDREKTAELEEARVRNNADRTWLKKRIGADAC